ncbi:MAG TPA: hypothetical protein VFB25_05425 [Gaiellaceae bacterium]|nr:hypothetical protein [Gaiellaceae bacterium]
MTLRDPYALPRLALAASLVVAPIAYLVSTLAAPPLESNEAAQLAQMAAHADRTYLFALLTIVGSMLLLPATVALTQLSARRSPWLAYLGGGLVALGVLVAIGDSFGLLWEWQMTARGSDRAQMAALLHRFDTVTSVALLFTIGGLALLAGCALLAAALWRSHAVPRWAAVALPVGAVANIAGFSANSLALLDASALVLLVAFMPAALKLVGIASARSELRQPLAEHAR